MPPKSSSPSEAKILAALTGDDDVSTAAQRQRIGRVISSAGAQALVMVDVDLKEAAIVPRLGAVVCLESESFDVVGTISGMSSPAPDMDGQAEDVLIVEIDLHGALTHDKGAVDFTAGIEALPALGSIASVASRDDLDQVYKSGGGTLLALGELTNFREVSTTVSAEKLIEGNFAIVGAADTGKSCAVVRIVRELIRNKYPVRTLIIDPHNEYANSFGTMARQMPLAPGSFPHWLLNFNELTFLIQHLTGPLSADERTLLEEATIFARKRHAQSSLVHGMSRLTAESVSVSIDTPIPYKVSDMLGYLDKNLHSDGDISGATFRRLRTRLTVISKDHRYAPIFGGLNSHDSLASLIGQLFNVPAKGQPITLLQLGEAPRSVAQVVISVVARLTGEVAKWSHGTVPMLLIVEDAHTFLARTGPFADILKGTLIRLMERGRKIGVGVGLVSSRPRALCEDALEQCASVFAFKLPTASDREAIQQITPENAAGLLSTTGFLGMAEAIAVGQAISMPARMRFGRIPAAAVPMEHVERGSDDLPEKFVSAQDDDFVDTIIARWRQQSFVPGSSE